MTQPHPSQQKQTKVGRKSGLIAPSAECVFGGKMAEGAGKQPPAFPPYDSQSHCERSEPPVIASEARQSSGVNTERQRSNERS